MHSPVQQGYVCVKPVVAIMEVGTTECLDL
jgi:hypothetical protein